MLANRKVDSVSQKACTRYAFVLMSTSYLIAKACEVGRGTASAFDPKLTASSNFSPYEFVYVCSIQASISLAEHATCYARSVCGAIKTSSQSTARTLEGKFHSFARASSCLLPIKTRCRDFELSLALYSKKACCFWRSSGIWHRNDVALTVPPLLPREMLPNCCTPSAILPGQYEATKRQPTSTAELYAQVTIDSNNRSLPLVEFQVENQRFSCA